MVYLMQSLDFQGKLWKVDPVRLIKEDKDDPVADFFLVLGLIYNDLKSLTYHFVNVQNSIKTLKLDEVTIERGEFAGMKSHLERLMVGTMRELFEFLESSNEILSCEEFKATYNRLNRDMKERWDTIVAVATNSGRQEKDISDFLRLLIMIRSNLAFHYQSTKVMRKGFIDFFYHNPKKQPANEKCYYSKGDTMRDTRFYFSDAAAQGSMHNQVSQKMTYAEYERKVSSVIDDANFAIMALMKEFLRTRPSQ